MEALIYILNTAVTLFLVAFVARLLAQMARADFYNPLAQTVVTITNPLLIPARKVIPSIGKFDTASLIVIWLILLAYGCLILLISGYPIGQYIVNMIAWSALGTLATILMVIKWSMIIVAVASFIAAGNYNPMLGFMSQIIEPFVGPFKKLNLQVGMLDLSFLLAFMALHLIQNYVILAIAKSLGYPTGLFLAL